MVKGKKMSKINYKEKYKLDEIVSPKIESLEESVYQLIEERTDIESYSIRKKKSNDFVLFGRNLEGGVKMDSNDALLILKKDKRGREIPVTVLRYGVYPKEISVGYIQTPYNVYFEDYKKIKSELGSRPHELIFAHFLNRITPILNELPDTNLSFSPFYLEKSLYAPLRDRFLNKKYNLNPNKARVQQILSKDNNWLDGGNIEMRSFIKKFFLTRYRVDLLIWYFQKAIKFKIENLYIINLQHKINDPVAQPG